MRPTGLFVLHDHDVPIVAFAGGSGITPVLSIIKSALATTTRSILLVYANRAADAVEGALRAAGYEAERRDQSGGLEDIFYGMGEGLAEWGRRPGAPS